LVREIGIILMGPKNLKWEQVFNRPIFQKYCPEGLEHILKKKPLPGGKSMRNAPKRKKNPFLG